MSAESIVVTILAAIGLIVIIAYLVYYLWLYMKHRSTQKIIADINPPGSYMQNSGIKCPDYWVNTGVDANGNYICKNSFNIQTHNPKTGTYAGKCSSDQMLFTPVASGNTWEYGNPNGLTSLSDKDKYNFATTSAVSGSLSRCQWINNCGPSSNIQGIWSGVNEICNSPPPSS
jgi:hypothetical protein